ncbi:MAG TPA: hypothetical protein VGF86_10785 [Candidatus Tumulicola sp.]
MKRPIHRFCCFLAAALALGGCQGGGMQNPVLPGQGGLGGASAVLGNGPSGATLVRVRVPWSLGSPASGAPLPGAVGNGPGALVPGGSANPPPFGVPSPTPGGLPGAAGQIQSLTLSVNGPTPVNQTVVLTAGAPGCVNVTGGAICQAALALLPGSYAAVVATFSSPNPTGANAVGNPQTIAFTVSYGGSNVVNLALAGTVAQVDVVPGSSMSGENAQAGIDLYGAGKHQLVAQLLDGNQDIILGPSAPAVAVAQVGGSLTLAIVAANPSTPNVFTVSPPPTYSGTTATLRVTATFPGQAQSPCTQAGATCSGSVAVDVRQLLAVANASANTVTLYAGGQNVPLVTIQNGITGPQALVFDAAGDLFVASQPGNVTEYVAPYTGPPATIVVGINHPQALAVDARNDLFVANGSATNTVTEYAPPYSGAPIATVSSGINDPVSVGLDGSANLFVANQAANTVTVYSAPYNGSPIVLSSGLNAPNSLAVDGRGNVFVSNLNSTPNSVVEFVPPLSNSSVPSVAITNGVNEQGAIGLSPSASLFVPNQGANTVTEYAAPYGGVPTTISGGQSQPVALAVDASANLYVANYGNNTVTVYPVPYNGVSWITLSNGVSNPQALALSPTTSGMAP